MAKGKVILVPGFLASSLSDSFPIPLLSGVWLNPLRLISGSFGKLQLPVAGEPPPPFPANTLNPGKALSFYYGLIIGYLLARGWEVHCVDADWRRAISHDAGLLGTAILRLSQSGPVQLLCHSRGGLVARAAIGQLAAAGVTGRVSRVIALGTPHTGSLQSAVNLACWGDPKRKLIGLGKSLPRRVSDYISLSEVNAVMRSWPALYELLPPPSAPWLSLTPPNALYLAATYAGSTLNSVQSLLTAALATWAGLPPKPAGVDWIDVAGLGCPTPRGIPDLTRITTPGSLSIDSNGDGVVVLESAHTGSSRLITTHCSHDLLPHDGRIFGHIHQALSGALNANVAIEGRVLTLSRAG